MNLDIDDNNNTAHEKSYSLRPRAVSKKDEEDADEEETWKPRSRSRKRQKQKSAPLSKYRRKTANARERSRMREINDAFEALRKAIPHLALNCDNNNEKTSKIMTLRLAMKYITALNNALEEPETYALDLQSNLLLDNSSTASSVSDQTTWRDQLFASSSPLDSTLSLQTPLPCPLRNTDVLPRVQFDPNQSSKTLSSSQPDQGAFSHFFINKIPEPNFKTSVQSLDIKTPSRQSHSSSLPELSRHTLTPPDESSLHLPFEELQPNPSSSITDFQFQASSSFFNTDFDGLPSPVMDFCDLFVT